MQPEKAPLLAHIDINTGEEADDAEPPADPLQRLLQDAGAALGALGHYLCHNTARWRPIFIYLLFECITGLSVIFALVIAALGRAWFAAHAPLIEYVFNVTRVPTAEDTDSLYGARMGQLCMSALMLLACYAGAAVYRRFVPP